MTTPADVSHLFNVCIPCNFDFYQVWEIEDVKHEPGTVLHTVGWPLDGMTYGGSFLYHMKDRLVSLCRAL